MTDKKDQRHRVRMLSQIFLEKNITWTGNNNNNIMITRLFFVYLHIWLPILYTCQSRSSKTVIDMSDCFDEEENDFSVCSIVLFEN